MASVASEKKEIKRDQRPGDDEEAGAGTGLAFDEQCPDEFFAPVSAAART